MSYRSSTQRATARLLSFIRAPQAWLLLIALMALAPGAAHAAASCSDFSVPDAHTTPSTSPMASGGSITIDVSSCDSSGFGLGDPSTATQPGHGSINVDPLGDTVTYTNNGDGVTSDAFTFQDINGNVVHVTVAIAAAASPITVSPASLPTPHVGSAYSQTLSATGGTAPYTYALTGGSLPSGLSLSGNTISGTPNQAGAYTATLTVTDNASLSTTKSYSVTVPDPSSSFTIATPPAANVNTPYSHTLAASGGTAPYTFALANGTNLPAGLSLASNGTISGTPTATGTTNFDVTVTDSSPGPGGPYFKTVAVSLQVLNVPPTAGSTSATVAYDSTNNNITLPITGAAATSVAVATQASHGTATASGTSITYTPTTGYAGPDSFTYTASNGSGTSSPATVTITVSPPTIVYAPSAPPHPTVGVSYNYSIASASGGAAPYTYAVSAGTLPAGISLATNGILSGTPTAQGTFTVQVRARDSSTGTGPFYSAPANVTLVINSPVITVSPGSLPGGTVNSSYSQTITASGGTAPYTYVLQSGTLPAGMTLSSSGVLSGTPTQSGNFSIAVQANDSTTGPSAPYHSNTATSGSYTLTIAAPTITVSPSSLPNATAGTAYSQTLSASGGTAPYTFSASSGNVPPGMTLSSDGTLSGTPTTAGDFSFTATATDAQSFTGQQNYTVHVSAVAPGAPTIGAATAGDAQASVAFTAPANNGGSPITGYTVTSSPGGFTASGAASPITVTGLTNGTSYTFTVTATNTAGTGSPSAASNAVTPRGGQTISFSNPGTQNYGTTPTLTATATSGLPVTFSSSTTAVCTVTSGGTLTFLSAGTCSIEANQPGNGTYLAAPTVTQTFTVAAVVPGAPTIGTATAGNAQASVSFTAPASNGGATIVGYTVTSSPGDITASGSASPITVTGLTNGTAYTFTVTAGNSAGTGSSSAASNSVTPLGTQTITFANPGSQNFGTSPQLTATASSGLPVSFTSSTTAVCTITSGGVLTTVTPGTCTINADQPGNGAYQPATTVSQSFTIVVPGGAVSFSSGPSLPNATGETPYSYTIAATGGAAPYTFSITGGTLPNGLSLSPAGVLSGTPLEGGTFTFGVRVTDAATQTADQTFQLVVDGPALSLSPTSLPNGTGGQAYTQNLSTSGGVAPYSYAVTAGALPTGMTLSSTGALSGTPTATGSASFTVTVTDQHGFQGSQAYTLAVDAPTITLDPATLPHGTGGQAYTQTLTASGGTASYSYAVTAGTLPAGLVLSPTGVLSGTPTASGSFNVTVTATDQYDFQGSQAYTLVIDAPAIAIAPATLPGGMAGQSYTQTLSASGGTSPYTYAVSVGTLPAGLTLSASGTLSGTPTAAGSFHITVTATDQHGFQGSQAYTLVIDAPTIAIDPATLPHGTGGQAYTQTLTASGGTASYSYAVTAGTLPAGLALSPAGVLSGTPTVSGSFSLTVTATDQHGFQGSQAYTLVVDAPAIAIAPATLPGGTVGQPYTQALSASGGTSPYTYAVSAGTLPAGLTLSASGTLSGTPTAAGSANVTVTVTDQHGFQGSQNYALTTVQPAPVAVNDTASVNANASVTVAVTANDSGPITSIAIAQAPAHGTATVSGLNVVYTPAHDYFGDDSFKYTATGPGGTSAAAVVSVTVIPGAVPVAAAQTAQVLAGKSVTIHAADNATNGPFTGAAISAAPTSGTATVQGTDIVYTADSNASGTFGLDYTLSNAFGASQPAHVTLTVNPRPVAPSLTAKTIAGTTVEVDLTATAHGGPFTGADLVSIAPANAGSARISASNGGYTLAFTPAATYSGTAKVTYTLSNAFATSEPGTVDIAVELRSDPSKDPEVTGVLDAQADATRRMAMGQINNFQRRL